MELKVKIENGL